MAATDPEVLEGRAFTAESPNGKDREAGSAGWVAAALESVLRARAPDLHASTPLVAQLAARVGRELDLDAGAQSLLEVSVRVRDIGMAALPDSAVLSSGPLLPADWQLVNRHPIIGCELLEGLAPVAPAAQIVRSHHERWDGDGYP